jgi:hypothetical protein
MSVRAAALEAVRRGHDLHYARSADPARPGDTELLDGDRLYAEGLATLAADGDLEGVRALAALITRCARAHAEGRPDEAASAWHETATIFG